MKYTPKYFKENMPEWKRKKDPILSRIFYRPCSFVVASVVSQFGINANTISYFSAIVAIIACIFFLTGTYTMQIIGAILVNIWLILDCTDGNLARSVKKQPFGEFADGMSGYILVGLICTCIGFSTYFSGGLLFHKGCIWIALLGAFASSSDTLMRLIYQKYKNTERDLADKGIINFEKEVREDNAKVGSFRVRVEAELGMGGILPLAILLGTLFKALDIVIIYCFAYFFLSFVVCTLMYTYKAIKKGKV